MKYFLSDERRAKLTEKLVEAGETETRAKVITDVEDDLFEVDIAMAAHVQLVIESGKAKNQKHVDIALLCSLTLMEEAMDRGLAETDFPMMLHAVQEDLRGRHGITVQ